MKAFLLKKLILRSMGSGLLFLAITSCGSKDDDAPEEGTCETSQATVASANFDQLWTNVFSKQCTGCHGVESNTTTKGGPNMLTADAFYAGLVGKRGSDYTGWDTFQVNRVPDCDPYQFIQSGNANQSMITAVLDPSVTLTGCKVVYHREAPQNVCITSGNLAKMKEWIIAGAVR